MKKMDSFLFEMRSLFGGLLFSLIFVGSLSAQISLISSFPIDGATSVDTAATLSFTFNQPVDVSANFEGLDMEEGFFLGLWLYPLGKSGEADSITFSFDFKTIYFHNVHLWPDTKYVVILLGAKSACGDSLDKPYVINFTTGANLPTNTISGTVVYAGGDPTNTIVSLLSLETGGEGPNFLASTIVSSPSGSYTIPYVETGDYAGVAILDANHNGNLDIEIDPLGWYDPDLDGVLDTLKVRGSMSGVNIVIGALAPQTARGLLAAVDASVKSSVPDAELVIIMGDELNLDGNADQWNYVYFSNSENKLYTVSTLGTSILPMSEEDTQFQIESLPVNWIDSDSALTIAEASGGSTFRATYPNTEISGVLSPASAVGLLSMDKASYSKDKLCWKLNPKNFMKEESFLQGQALWRIEYNSDTAGDDTTITLDAVTGLVTGVESEKIDTSLPYSFELRQNYPNPFNPTTTIAYNLPRTAEVDLTIYDLLGHEVQRLFDGVKPAGTHTVQWNGRDGSGLLVASGMYFCRIAVKGKEGGQRLFVDVKKMILMK